MEPQHSAKPNLRNTALDIKEPCGTEIFISSHLMSLAGLLISILFCPEILYVKIFSPRVTKVAKVESDDDVFD